MEPSTSPPDRASAVAGLLLDSYPALLSRDEIRREIGDEARVDDALDYLERIGLAHRVEDFFWTSRAALAADELAT
jgi:hypothetical protein